MNTILGLFLVVGFSRVGVGRYVVVFLERKQFFIGTRRLIVGCILLVGLFVFVIRRRFLGILLYFVLGIVLSVTVFVCIFLETRLFLCGL